jgi:hypothetical protein
MTKRPTKTWLTFATAGLLSFAALVPGLARSINRTVPNQSCTPWPGNNSQVIPPSGNSFTCGIPIGSDLPTSTITEAYFDYFMGAGQTNPHATLSLNKVSYTGALYSDYVNGGAGGSNQQFDTYMVTSQINRNPSTWDYLSANVMGVAWMTGVAVYSP